MDIQAVAGQLISALGSNPDLVKQFAEHPYSTTAEVTGTDETISQKDMSRIITQVAAQASGQQLDTAGTKDLASSLLGQAGSVHSLASSLFGGGQGGGLDLGGILGSLTGGGASGGNGQASAGPSMAEIAAKSIAGAAAARGLAALITGAMGTNKQQ